MLLHQFLYSSTKKYPDKTAIVHQKQRIAYRQLDTYSENTAHWLLSHGIEQGERVVILFENSIDYVVAYYGILKAGGVCVPLSPGLKPPALSPILNELKPWCIIASQRLESLLVHTQLPESIDILLVRGKSRYSSVHGIPIYHWDDIYTTSCKTSVRKEQKIINENDLASIIYTSGSTGAPKGVMLSHKNLVSNTLSICSYLHLTHNDVQMVVLPFFYVMGKSLLNTHIAAGGTIVINNTFAYPASVLSQMEQEHVTGFAGVPSTYAYLLHKSPLREYRDRLPSLRYCTQAGGHMAMQIKKELRAALPHHTEIYIMYGATEASARLTYLEPALFSEKMDSIGKPIPGVTIKILDKKGHAVPAGSVGELVASGDNIMKGYWNDKETTKQVLDTYGYHTSDMGYVDNNGFLYVTGRKDNMCKVGGHRINLQEVEDALMATEKLLEAIVLDVEDSLLGTAMVALVAVRDESCKISTIFSAVSKMLPSYKVPGNIVIMKRLPKKENGKIDRAQCRKYISNQT